MQFTITIEPDGDYTPWGDPEVVDEEIAKIRNKVWAAYVVTVRAAGPVESEGSVTGCVVPVTDTGAYHEFGEVTDPHLRGVAEGLAREIESGYLEKLYDKRNQITAMIRRMGGN